MRKLLRLCPLCDAPAEIWRHQDANGAMYDASAVHCDACGEFVVSNMEVRLFRRALDGDDPTTRALLPHLSKHTRTATDPPWLADDWRAIAEEQRRQERNC